MNKEIEKTVPYSQLSFATEPTKSTRFWRKFIPLQLIKFFTLNLKIMRIVVGGQSWEDYFSLNSFPTNSAAYATNRAQGLDS